MLSLFPNLFTFPLFAYFILRLVVAYQFALIAKARFKKPYKYIAFVEMIVIIFVTLGLYTQGALIGVMALLIVESALERKVGTFNRTEANLRTTLGLIALSLMFLGAGAFAFDLPL